MEEGINPKHTKKYLKKLIRTSIISRSRAFKLNSSSYGIWGTKL